MDDPDLRSLVDSNSPPNEDFYDLLANHVRSTQFATLEMTRKAQGLLDQAGLYEDWLKDARRVMHPVRRLPADILREIFLRCRPNVITSFFNAPATSTLDTTQAPWNLSQVSSRWRQVALSFPGLWSSISVSWNSVCERPMTTEKVLFCQISRSGSALLDLSVDLHGFDATQHLYPAIMAILVSHSHRWQYLSLSMTSDILDDVLSLAEGRLGSLWHLTISTASNSHRETLSDVFLSASSLEVVHMHRISKLRLPHAKMKRLGCILLDSPLIPTDLSKCMNLTHLTIHLASTNELPAFPSPVHLPRLQHLVIGAQPKNRGSCLEILQSLNTPSLMSLSLFTPSCTIDAVRIALTSLLERSGCLLEELTIGFQCESISPLLHIQDVNSVRRLVCFISHMDDVIAARNLKLRSVTFVARTNGTRNVPARFREQRPDIAEVRVQGSERATLEEFFL